MKQLFAILALAGICLTSHAQNCTTQQVNYTASSNRVDSVPVSTNNIVPVPYPATSNLVTCTTTPPTNSSWAIDVGGAGSDTMYSVAVAPNGNSVVAGAVGGAGYIAIYDPTGVYVSSITIPNAVINGVAVDQHTGNIGFVGYFTGSTTIGAKTYLAVAGKDILLGYLSPGLSPVWSRQISGHGNPNMDDFGYGVAIDPNNGDVVVCGAVGAYTDFGGGLVFIAPSSTHSFVSAYAPSGAYLWAKYSASISGDFAKSVAIDSAGNITVVGFNLGAINWGGGNLSPAPFSPYQNSYEARFSSSGTYQWSQAFGTTGGTTLLNGVAVNSNDESVVVGSFTGTMNIPGLPPLSSVANQAAFIVKSSASGVPQFAKAYPPSGNSLAGVFSQFKSVAFDPSGNILLAGDFSPSCDFGTGLLNSLGTVDASVVKLNTSLSTLSAIREGGAGYDSAFGITSALDGSVVVCGATVGGIWGTNTLITAGGQDGVLQDIAP